MLWKIAQFYREEDSSIVIEAIKGNLKLATFFLLDVFMGIKIWFFVFARLYVFFAFCACKSFS